MFSKTSSIKIRSSTFTRESHIMKPLTLKTPSFAKLAVASAAFLHIVAFADAPPGGGSDESNWGLGFAVRSETRAYSDFDNKTEVWPLVTYENRWVRVFGPNLEWKLDRSGPFAFGLAASYADDGYEAKDAPVLAGMDERKNSFWLGGNVAMRTDLATFSGQWMGDASGKSKGQKLKLGMQHRFAVGDVGVTPSLGAVWQDSKFVNYYYGVKASEVRAGRAAYNPGSAVNVELGLRLDYRLAPQQMLFANLGVTSLDSAIKNSPLVDRSSTSEIGIGYMYRF
jgi:MipA family protein